MAKQKKNKLIKLEDTPILKAIDINSIGDNGDPCFGKEYDLSTEECRSCGDTELCCIKFAALMGKTREELVDKIAAKKTYRALKRKGDTKKVILDKLQAKYAISREQARLLYKEFSDK